MKQKIYNNLELITDIILCFFIIIMFVIYNGKSSIIYMISLAMLLLVTFVNFIKNRKLLIDKKVIWMLIFPLLGLISFFWADNKQNVMSVLLILVGNEIITYCIMLLIYYKNKRLDYVLHSIMIGTILLALRLFIPNGFLVYYSVRIAKGLLNANYIGMYAAISCTIAIYYLLKTKQKGYILLFIACLIITILSFSRKAIVFLILPLLMYFIVKDYSLKKIGIRILISILILSIMLIAFLKVGFLYDIMGNRIESMINGIFDTGEKVDASVSARMTMIEIGKELFAKKPFLGYGLNNYKNMLADEKKYGMTNVYAHNNYIELAVDLGIVGTFIYYSIYLYILGYAIKNYKKLNKLQVIMVAILITLMICEYGIVSYYGDFYHLILTIIWMSLMYEEQPSNDNSNS